MYFHVKATVCNTILRNIDISLNSFSILTKCFLSPQYMLPTTHQKRCVVLSMVIRILLKIVFFGKKRLVIVVGA